MSWAFPKGTGQMVDSGQRLMRDLNAGNATAGSIIDEAVNLGAGLAPPQYAIPIKTAYELAQQVKSQQQPQSKMKGGAQKTKQSGKQKTSNNGSGGSGVRSPRYNNSIPEQQPSNARGNSAYGNVSPGGKVDLNTQNDNSTYKIPSKTQSISNDENSSLTWIQCIGIKPGDVMQYVANAQVEVAFDAIYKKYKASVVANTRGGTGSTALNFTKTNFIAYLTTVMSGYAMLSEYYALRTLNPRDNDLNTVLSSMSDSVNSADTLMKSAYRLDTIISELSLPPAVCEFYQFLFQTYKKSPVSGGVHQKFMSHQFCHDFIGDDATFASTVSAMDAVYDTLIATESMTVISALMSQISDYNFMMLDKVKSGSPNIEFDMKANAMFDNSSILYYDGTDHIVINDEIQNGDSMKAAFPMEKTEVPILVTSYLLLNFEQDHPGYPFFKVNKEGNHAANSFILTNKTTHTTGVEFHAVKEASKQIIDHNWQINTSSNGAMFLPKGLNTQQYALTYTSTSDACQEMVLDFFGVAR
uniref:Capsid protein n=1 Tax=viral metagenome TaxID=1070528 RepID=A0A2V0RBC4_9ZZZZ